MSEAESDGYYPGPYEQQIAAVTIQLAAPVVVDTRKDATGQRQAAEEQIRDVIGNNAVVSTLQINNVLPVNQSPHSEETIEHGEEDGNNE